MAAAIKLEQVNKSYLLDGLKVPAVTGISLTVDQGEFVALIGPSGSGKSTLMSLIGCLDQATSGQIYLGNQKMQQFSESDLAQIRGQKIGFIFQTFNLIPTLNALDNVALPMIFQRQPSPLREGKARRLLKQVGLADRWSHLPSQLSGGQKQRVAVARALINDPEIILADEPTGNLDTKSGTEIMALLKGLNRQGKTIILVTHNLELTKIADRIFKLKDGQLVKGGW